MRLQGRGARRLTSLSAVDAAERPTTSSPASIERLTGSGQPPAVVEVNDTVVRVARLEGRFPFVVPCGAEDRPVADSPAHTVIRERPETKQYGS